MIKILSWNCRLPPWAIDRKQRIPKIVDAIEKLSPDIICLQEVFFKKDGIKIGKLLRKKGYNHSFHFKDLLIISRIKLFNRRGKQFEEQGNLFSLAALDVIYGKGFQSTQFLVKNHIFSLINIHALSAWAIPFSSLQKVREKQVKEAEHFSFKRSKKRIILGDFNFKPNTLPYYALTNSGFRDCSKKTGNTFKNKKLDFVFSKNIPQCDAHLVLKNKFLSDHLALEVVIN